VDAQGWEARRHGHAKTHGLLVDEGLFHFCCNFFIWHYLNIEGGC